MSPLLRQLRSDGFADFGELDPGAPTHVVARGVADRIGAVLSTGHQDLRASQAGSKGVNTYGGNYGLGQLPLHTDLAHWHLPPRYVMLRCIVGSPDVGTHVLHYQDVAKQIPTTLMRQALFSPRRRLDGKMYLLRMLTDELFRWDELFLEPKNRAAVEVRQLMLDSAEQLKPAQIWLDKPGRTLLIDNWHALHGRSSVPISETGRHLERIYLEESTDGHEDTT